MVDFGDFFVCLKFTYLVTLFDCKLEVFRKSPKWTIFGLFNEFFVQTNKQTNKQKLARFARNLEWDIFGDFQT